MADYVTAYFTENGTPKTGLSPTVTIWDISDGSEDVSAAAMTEVAGGWYRYDFSGRDTSKDYVGRIDGGVGQPTVERYIPVDIPAADSGGVLDGVVEGAVTVKHVLSVLLAAAAGIADGGGSNIITFYNQAEDVERLVLGVDEQGNRVLITIDVSDL